MRRPATSKLPARFLSRWLLLAWLCLASALAWAADDLVAVPPLKARVTDLSGTLSSGQVAQLEQQLAAFEQERGSQIAILLVPTTAPEPIEMYSIRVAESWKIGRRKHDDGVLMLVAKNDRKLRIDVGYGLEGAIPDAIAKRVVAEVITPRFRQGDFFGGLQAGVAQIQSLIEGEQLPAPDQWGSGAQPESAGGFGEMLVVGIIAAVVLGGILNAIFGRLLGSGITGGLVGGLGWLITTSLAVGIIAAIAVFLFALAFGGRGAGSRHGGWGGGGGVGGIGGGGWGGGGGGGWGGGGGGGFGGGGASGSW